MAEVVKTSEQLASEAFAAHPHVQKVWVDVAKQEWHIHDKSKSVEGLKEVARPSAGKK